MATTNVLQEVTLHLRRLLVDEANLVRQNISLDSPVEFDGGTPRDVKLSLYLYHIEKSEHLNNEPLLRAGNELYVRPFYVDLHYLLTPVTNKPEENLALIAQVIQVFSTHTTIRQPFLKPAREDGPDEARLRMLFHDLDDMNKLWGALAKPYRLSVAYEVSPVPIENVIPPTVGPPVAEAILNIEPMNGRA